MTRFPEVCSSVFCPLKFITTALNSRRLFRLTSCETSLLLICIVYSFSSSSVCAQGTTATLSGIVTDPNDAVIPGVNVAVFNIAQGFQRSTVTNGEGSFVVPLLPPGVYTVKAEREGFTPAEVRDVVLR